MDVLPDIGMLHPVLQITIARADRGVEPGGHEDAQRGCAVRVDVHEAKDFGFRITECMNDRAGFERAGLRQFNDGLHAHGPVMLMIAGWQAEMLVELAADSADRSVADYGETRMDIHARHISRWIRIALLVHALICEAYTEDLVALQDRCTDGRTWPDLSKTGTHDLSADPGHKGPHGGYEAMMLLEEGGDPRQFDCIRTLLHGKAAALEDAIDKLGAGAAATSSDRVMEIYDMLGICGRCVGNLLGEIHIREGGLDGAR